MWGKSFFAVVFLLGKVSEEGGEHRGAGWAIVNEWGMFGWQGVTGVFVVGM
ncbi:MAG: hypothetical protein HFH12_03120 [Dorea sp.]|nr:hypothetical protein [Dorea sp.]